MNASEEIRKPRNVASCSGRCENEEIASSEKRSIFDTVYFVSPAWRGSRR